MYKRFGTLGSILLLFIGINLLLGSFFVLINKSLEGSILIISFCISIIALFFQTDRKNKFILNVIINFVIFTVILLCAIKVSEMYYDFSFDGQTYHQEALIHMKSGWNPLYEQLTTDSGQDLWINHYAKGIWYLGTIIYDFTGKIESAKAVSLILLIGTFLILLSYIQNKINNQFLAWIISVLMIFSPVVINQLFTNYNDFFIGLLFITLIVGYMEFLETKDKKMLINIFVSTILLINIKFTALGYAVILTGIPIIICAINLYRTKNKNDGLWKSSVTWLTLTIISSFIIAIFFVGTASYVKNTWTNGHPFYPLAGEGKVDIMTINSPKGIPDLNRFEKLYVSIFSKTSNSLEEEPKTKFPVSISSEEIMYSTLSDTRIGGFGPLFGLIIILTFGMVVANYRKIKTKDAVYGSILLGILMLSILINPETWWARYIPQLWIIPLLIIILFLNSKIKSFVAYSILLVYSVNVCLIGYASMNKLYEGQLAIENQFEQLKEQSQIVPLEIEFGAFKANRARLDEQGIKYKEVDSVETCQNVIQLTYSTAKVCLIDMDNK